MLEAPFKDILSMAIFDAADTLLILEEEHSEVKMKKCRDGIQASPTKEDYHDRVRIPLVRHGTPKVCWQ